MTFRNVVLCLFAMVHCCVNSTTLCTDIHVYDKEHTVLSTEADLLHFADQLLENTSKIKCAVFCLNSPTCHTSVHSAELQMCYLTSVKPQVKPTPYIIQLPSSSALVTKNTYTYFTNIGNYHYSQILKTTSC